MANISPLPETFTSTDDEDSYSDIDSEDGLLGIFPCDGYLYGDENIMEELTDLPSPWAEGDEETHYPTSFTMIQLEATASKTPTSCSEEVDTKVSAIRGADIVAEVKLDLTPGKPLTYRWEGHGFEVHIPADAISDDIGPVTLSIQASLSGDYQLPDDDHVFVSGVYWLALHPHVKFTKEVTVTIEHCAVSDADSAISFITAMCTQKTLPYLFKPLSGGSFSAAGTGTIEVDHFSAIGAVAKKSVYAFCTYYIRKHINVYDAHITVTPNLKLHLKEVDKKYRKMKGIDKGDTITAQVEKDEISLPNILESNWCVHSDGWKLSSIKPPTLQKAILDDYRPGRVIPYFAINLKLEDPSKEPRPLSHRVEFTGVIIPTYITISRLPGPGDTHKALTFPMKGKRVSSSSTPSAKQARLSDDVTPTSSGTHGISDEKRKIYEVSPTLPQLLLLKIHEHVGARNLRFGIILLDDENGSLIESIQKENKSPEDVVIKILQQWLQGKGLPVSWESLVKAINISGPSTLAKEIQSNINLLD